MNLTLREVQESDMMLLYQWANDQTVRQNAFHTEQIPLEDHKKWFARMLKDSDVLKYILCENDMPVGQIRLNLEDDKIAYIDYSIDALQRGKGFGSQMLTLLEEKLQQIAFHGSLIGQVKFENAGSAKVFRKCGFTEYKQTQYLEFKKLI